MLNSIFFINQDVNCKYFEEVQEFGLEEVNFFSKNSDRRASGFSSVSPKNIVPNLKWNIKNTFNTENCTFVPNNI